MREADRRPAILVRPLIKARQKIVVLSEGNEGIRKREVNTLPLK